MFAKEFSAEFNKIKVCGLCGLLCADTRRKLLSNLHQTECLCIQKPKTALFQIEHPVYYDVIQFISVLRTNQQSKTDP